MTPPATRLVGSPRPALVALAGSAVAIGLTTLVANADLGDNVSPVSTALDAVVGLLFLGGAAVAPGPWRARALFGAVGFTWLLGSLTPGIPLAYAGVLSVALVTFPDGRPSSTLRWLLVAMSLLAVVAEPGDAVLASLFTAIAVTAAFGRRWERAASAFPAIAAGALGGLLAAHAVVEHQPPAGFDEGMWLFAQEALLVLIAASFPVAAWAVIRERAMLADRLLADEHPAGLDGLAVVLATTLHEPHLRVFRWDGDAGSYVDRDGRRAVLGNGVSVIAVNDGHERLAIVAHDRPAAMQDPVVARAVAEAVRLAALNERWQQALRVQLAELEAARARLLAATDRQRAAIAVRLLDEVVRPIESGVAALHTIDATTSSTGQLTGGADAREARDALRIAREELATSIEEILSLTDGLPPAGLGDGGLVAALRRLAGRCPIPVTLTMAPDAAADPDRETALFYVCSEALANTMKHARASRVSIDLRRERAGLILVIADDGVGGASADGFGLRGLADRLAAYGGRLRVDSPPGAGTTLTARIGG